MPSGILVPRQRFLEDLERGGRALVACLKAPAVHTLETEGTGADRLDEEFLLAGRRAAAADQDDRGAGGSCERIDEGTDKLCERLASSELGLGTHV